MYKFKFISNIIGKICSGDSNTILVKKNIIGSLILKIVSIIISFQVVPLTINFVNPTQYGIWLTLSSLMSWFFFFDIGLTNGFRNRFAEAKAKGKIRLARIYVSTTYAALFILYILMLMIVLPINMCIDWSEILKVDISYNRELCRAFMIMISCLGLNIVAQVFSTLVTADQHPVLVSFIQVIGQAIAFIIIFILVNTISTGNLISLAIIFSGMPVLVLIIASVYFYFSRYHCYRPSFSYVRFKYIRNILGIGGKFFVITTSMLFIFQLMNVIISRILGPEIVTEYNLAYKYFNILFMVAVLVLNPFWSAFTDAYTRGDFNWMQRMYRKLEYMWLLSIPIIVLMYFCAPWFYKFWIKDAVIIPTIVNISVAIYISVLIIANVYMHLINGIGKVQIQLIIYTIFAIIAYPLMTLSCRKWGIPGLLAIPTLVYVLQAFLGKIQLSKILRNEAIGLWGK